MVLDGQNYKLTGVDPDGVRRDIPLHNEGVALIPSYSDNTYRLASAHLKRGIQNVFNIDRDNPAPDIYEYHHYIGLQEMGMKQKRFEARKDITKPVSNDILREEQPIFARYGLLIMAMSK